MHSRRQGACTESGPLWQWRRDRSILDPFNRVAVLQYLEPWKRTVDEDTESVAEFFLRIENVRRYRFQVHRWLAEMLMAYIGFNCMLREEATNPRLPGLQTGLRMLYEDPANRLDPVVQQYHAKFPKSACPSPVPTVPYTLPLTRYHQSPHGSYGIKSIVIFVNCICSRSLLLHFFLPTSRGAKRFTSMYSDQPSTVKRLHCNGKVRREASILIYI